MAKSMKGYESIMWLVASVMLKRDFAIHVEVRGVDEVMKDCPYHDLTAEQKATFEAALDQPLLKTLVRAWWEAYDGLRNIEAIPAASTKDPWWP